jgi:hypothetical protein
MNVELEKTFSFPSVLVSADMDPWINNYDVEIGMRPITHDSKDYNIAYGRIKFWFYEIMHGAVLIHRDNPRLQSWRDTGMNCLDFPEDPMDHVVGLMLMSKLSSISESRIEILRLGISSPADDHVTYFCDHTDDLHWFEQPGWWRESGPTHATDTRRSRKSGKVISISPVQDWKQHDLDWSTNTDDAATVATVTSFTKDD